MCVCVRAHVRCVCACVVCAHMRCVCVHARVLCARSLCVCVCCVCVVCVCVFVCVLCVLCVWVVCVCVCFFFNICIRHAPLQKSNTTCFIGHLCNFFVIGDAVTNKISGFPLHLHLHYIEHLKTDGVNKDKAMQYLRPLQ